jgi:hypothetical protein
VSELTQSVVTLIEDREAVQERVELLENELRFLLHELVADHWMGPISVDNNGNETSQCRFCEHRETHRGPGY